MPDRDLKRVDSATSPRRELHLSSQMAGLQFWKPGTLGPGSNLDRAAETEENVVPSAPSTLSLQATRERLPIFKHSM